MKENLSERERLVMVMETSLKLLSILKMIETGDFFVPKHIIHNRKTGETTVIWKDGERTTVKPMEGMPDSEMSSYSAFTACLAKKIFGSNSRVNRIVEMTNEPVKREKK